MKTKRIPLTICNTIVLVPDTPDTLTARQDSVDINTILLKETKGATLIDKPVFFSLKNIYLASRLLSMLVLGKKKTDRLYIERGISFKSFLSKSLKFLGVDNLLLIVNVPEYGYQVYCRSEDNFNDFVILTQYGHNLIERLSHKEGDIVVDVGAHTGLYTIISSKRVGQNGKVVAIEADPIDFELLSRNIKLNGLTHVIGLNHTVYSKETKLKFYLPLAGTKSNTIMSDTIKKTEEKFIEINPDRLDDLLQQNGIRHSDVNWLKIDVEGGEIEILKGATKILSKSKDIALLIEVHNSTGSINLYRQIIEFLNVYNFKIKFENTYESGEKYIIARR
jgi:FkbM family methyltransferase